MTSRYGLSDFRKMKAARERFAMLTAYNAWQARLAETAGAEMLLVGDSLGMVEHGLPATTPAAVVQQGTSREQRVVTGTLADLARRAARARLKAPTLIIVGSVVKLRDRLAWFDA